MDDDFGFDDAMMLGTGYALYRHGQDRLAADISAAVRAALSEWEPVVDDSAVVAGARGVQRDRVLPVDLDSAEIAVEWSDYIGQPELIEELRMRVDSARIRHGRIPHTLVSSDKSGMGRRTAVRLAARELGKSLIELPAPFTIDALVSAVEQLGYADVLFVDDLELACSPGGPGSGVLSWLLENREVLHPDGTGHFVDEVSVVASTTRMDQLPASILDHFPVHVAMAPYSLSDLGRLAVSLAFVRRSQDIVTNQLALEIGKLSAGGGPADVDRLVLLVRDLAVTLGRAPDINEIVRGVERGGRR